MFKTPVLDRRLKALLKMSGQLMLVLFLTMLIVFTFISPAKFKQTLQKEISTQTNRHCIIQGPARLNVVRGFKLEISDVILSSPVPFSTPIVSIKRMYFKPHFLSLLTGKVRFDIEAHEPTFHLENLASDHSNWQGLLDKHTLTSMLSNIQASQLIFSRFSIKNGEMTIQDKYNALAYSLKDIQLRLQPLTHALVGNKSELSLSFTTLMPTNTHQSKVNLSAFFTLNQKTGSFEVHDLNLSSGLPNQTPMRVLGSLAMHTFNDVHLGGDLKFENIDLSPLGNYLQLPFKENAYMVTHLTAQFNYKDAWLDIPKLSVHFGKGTLEGNLKCKPEKDSKNLELQANLVGALFEKEYKVQDIKTSMVMKNGILDINPIEFQFAKGKHEASLRIEYHPAAPKYTATYMGDNFEIATLLEVLGHKEKVSGKAHLKASLSSQGKSSYHLLQNLYGQGDLEIKQGNLYGVQLLYLLKHARGSLKSIVLNQKQEINPTELVNAELHEWNKQAQSGYTFETPFDKIQASALIYRGTINNPDLMIQHEQYKIEGKGTLDLNQSTLQYQSMAHYKDPSHEPSEELNHLLKDTPLIIHVSGQLDNPAVHPDLNRYLQHSSKFTQKNMFDKFVDKSFYKLMDESNP